MAYLTGFVPTMYVEQIMCENREKRQRSAKRNFNRMNYELIEEGKEESFEVMLDDEIRKISRTNRDFS